MALAMNLFPVVWVPGNAKKREPAFTARLSKTRESTSTLERSVPETFLYSIEPTNSDKNFFISNILYFCRQFNN